MGVARMSSWGQSRQVLSGICVVGWCWGPSGQEDDNGWPLMGFLLVGLEVTRIHGGARGWGGWGVFCLLHVFFVGRVGPHGQI